MIYRGRIATGRNGGALRAQRPAQVASASACNNNAETARSNLAATLS